MLLGLARLRGSARAIGSRGAESIPFAVRFHSATHVGIEPERNPEHAARFEQSPRSAQATQGSLACGPRTRQRDGAFLAGGEWGRDGTCRARSVLVGLLFFIYLTSVTDDDWRNDCAPGLLVFRESVDAIAGTSAVAEH